MESERGSGITADRTGSISVWRIELDEKKPGTIVTRDERGAIAFVSNDGGRSWQRVGKDG